VIPVGIPTGSLTKVFRVFFTCQQGNHPTGLTSALHSQQSTDKNSIGFIDECLAYHPHCVEPLQARALLLACQAVAGGVDGFLALPPCPSCRLMRCNVIPAAAHAQSPRAPPRPGGRGSAHRAVCGQRLVLSANGTEGLHGSFQSTNHTNAGDQRLLLLQAAACMRLCWDEVPTSKNDCSSRCTKRENAGTGRLCSSGAEMQGDIDKSQITQDKLPPTAFGSQRSALLRSDL
jgi:hypothetical protein